MVWNDELEKEVPEGWEVKKLNEVSTIIAGGDKPADFSEFETEKYKYPVYSNSSKDNGLYGYTSKPKILKKSITISARGAIIGFTKMRTIPFVPIVRLIVVIPNKEFEVNYLYSTIQKFSYHENSSAQGQLTVPEISNYQVLIPSSNILEDYDKSLTDIYWQINSNDSLNISLMSFSNILLSKMTNSISLQKSMAT